MTSKTSKGLSGKKLNPFEKVRQRPGAYGVSISNTKSFQFIFEEESQTIIKTEIHYNEAIVHCCVEILSNAIDNFWRSQDFGIDMTYISIDVGLDPEKDDWGWITIKNDGYFIPVELREYTTINYRTKEETTEQAYPADIFWGEFDSGTNYENDSTRKSSGLHGQGGKIVTALSQEMIIDHTDSDNKKKYVKYYSQGGKEQTDPKITSYSGKAYTSVAFLLDYEYLKCDGINQGLGALLKRYAYEAAMITGLKVTFNGERLKVKNLETYVRFFYPDTSNKLVHFYAPNGDECVIISGEIPETNTQEKATQVSWVNGINTSEGGIHVNAWSKAIFPKLVKAFNAKKRKKGTPPIKVSAKRLYPWLTLYVRAESYGALFESNAKKIFTSFKSEGENGEEILEEIDLYGSAEKEIQSEFEASLKAAVDKMMSWDFIAFIEEQLIAEAEVASLTSKKISLKKMTGDKYVDANNVLTEPDKCSLLICEGGSAHEMASRLVAYLPGGQDYWGIFELRGKFLNTMKANPNAISKNEEFQKLKEMTGLIPFQDYSKKSQRSKLRYGKILFLTDADPDGYHIRGLLLSTFMKFFPTIVSEDPEKSMVGDFNTMVISVHSKSGAIVEKFYSVPSFLASKFELKKDQYIRYMKGTGSHEPKDTASYKDDARIRTYYKDPNGLVNVTTAFGKEPAPRKAWIMNALVDGYDNGFQTQGSFSVSEFINKDLVPFAIESLDRAIPSILDSFKFSQRQVAFGMDKIVFPKQGVDEMVTVTGKIKSVSGYHHGNLYETVVRMAQNYPGSNNIPILRQSGEFGTRQTNGVKFAADRYLKVGKSKIFPAIFSPLDVPILERRLHEDGKTRYEYIHYAPVVCLTLINGCEAGIATGWSSTIPAYNPLDIVRAQRQWLAGQELHPPLKPWYRGFTGEIKLMTGAKKPVEWDESCEEPPARWLSIGRITESQEKWSKGINKKGFIIDEIPIGLATNKLRAHIEYFHSGKKLKVEKKKVTVTAKIKPRLRDFRDYSSPEIPYFEILPTKDYVPDINVKGNFDILKMTHSLTNMILLNAKGIPTKYARAEDILTEWCEWRYQLYEKRKQWWVSRWTRDLVRQTQRYKYVKAVIDGDLDLHQKAQELEESMLAVGLKKLVPDSKWKSSEENEEDPEAQEGAPEDENLEEGNFDYLLSMQMRSMTVERLEEIRKEKQRIQEKIDDYNSASAEELWERDLVNFEKAYAIFLKDQDAIFAEDIKKFKEIKNKKMKKGKAK